MPETIFDHQDLEITLDGKSILHRISGLSIQYDEDSVHNSISFDSIDYDLYRACDPSSSSIEARIIVSFGDRELFFLLEKRNGSHSGRFSFWGRSLSAILDEPHSEPVTIILTSQRMASSVAAELCKELTLDWRIQDWMLPMDYSFSGIPMEGIIELADQMEAIVRSSDDGTIIVRPKFEVRPIDIPNSTISFSFDPFSHLFELSVQENKGSGQNSVQVDGYAEDSALPTLEVETGNGLRKGQTFFVRAYWGVERPPEDLGFYATSGKIKYLGEFTETKSEIIVFENGKSSAQKPISKINSVVWYGMNAGDPSFNRFSKDLIISTNHSRIARIVYETVYRRYKLFEHDESHIAFNLLLNPNSMSVSAVVKIRDGLKSASGISKPILTSHPALVKAGTAFLDKTFYDNIEVTFRSTFESGLEDGMIIDLDDAELSVSGRAHCSSVNYNFDGVKTQIVVKAILFKI